MNKKRKYKKSKMGNTKIIFLKNKNLKLKNEKTKWNKN